jgi:hypothetical protein
VSPNTAAQTGHCFCEKLETLKGLMAFLLDFMAVFPVLIIARYH